MLFPSHYILSVYRIQANKDKLGGLPITDGTRLRSPSNGYFDVRAVFEADTGGNQLNEEFYCRSYE
jgi:hypothetical protein